MKMIEFTEELLSYLKTANTSPALENAEELVGSRQLRIISMNIVDWLKLEGKRTTSKPMKLNDSYPWANNLKNLISTDELFKTFFTVNDNNEFDIDNSVSMKERKESFSLAEKEYNPPRMT